MTLSIALMMIGTTLMAVTPGYATIGLAAPIIITIARLLHTGFIATLIGGAILAIGSPLAGHWSDKAGRPLIMVVTCWLFPLTAYPCFYLMAAFPSLATCIFAAAWLNLVKAGYSGELPSLLAEQFPVEARAIGVSLSFSTAVSIFGGLAPFIATLLIAETGDKLSPSYYLIFTAFLSLIALMAIQRRVVRTTNRWQAVSPAASR